MAASAVSASAVSASAATAAIAFDIASIDGDANSVPCPRQSDVMTTAISRDRMSILTRLYLDDRLALPKKLTVLATELDDLHQQMIALVSKARVIECDRFLLEKRVWLLEERLQMATADQSGEIQIKFRQLQKVAHAMISYLQHFTVQE